MKLPPISSQLVFGPILVVIGLILLPNFGHHGGFDPQNRLRLCHASLKMIAGAVEMYELDKKASLDEMDEKTLELLVKDGYLQSIPSDPNPASRRSGLELTLSFCVAGDQKILVCHRHGVADPRPENPGASPYDQLQSLGVTDLPLLEAVSREAVLPGGLDPWIRKRGFDPASIPWATLILFGFLILCMGLVRLIPSRSKG